jgi:membrane associated rhomboid family serine protease
MQCSHCDQPLIKKKNTGIDINLCHNCKALWISSKDLFTTVNFFIDHPDLSKLLKESPIRQEEIVTGYCADCNEIATPAELVNPEVKFLRCVGCNGIWIDYNNMEKLLEWWVNNSELRNTFLFNEKEKHKLVEEGSFWKSLLGWMEDENPLNRTPIATIVLVFLNIIGFFVLNVNMDAQNRAYMFTPSLFLNDPGKEFITLFTSMFMHASPAHLVGNMIFLYMFGNNVEDRIGWVKYVAIYLIIGVMATLFFAAITVQKDMPSLGASGAISGILGAYLLLYPKVTIKQYRLFFFAPFTFNIPAWVYLGVWFLGQQLFGIVVNIPGIGWVVHLTGFILGYLVLFAMRKLDYL